MHSSHVEGVFTIPPSGIKELLWTSDCCVFPILSLPELERFLSLIAIILYFVLLLRLSCLGKETCVLYYLSLGQLSPTFLVPGTGSVEDNFSTDGAGGWCRRYCERWGAAVEASLLCPPLTSCCAAPGAPGWGEPLLESTKNYIQSQWRENSNPENLEFESHAVKSLGLWIVCLGKANVVLCIRGIVRRWGT